MNLQIIGITHVIKYKCYKSVKSFGFFWMYYSRIQFYFDILISLKVPYFEGMSKV